MDRRTALPLLAAGLALLTRSGSADAAAEGPFSAYDAESFKKLLASGDPIVVHVHAVWCSTCKAQMPTLLKLATDPANAGIHFVRVDFDTDQEFLKAYKVPSQSLIMVMKRGTERVRFGGITRPSEIELRIGKALA